MTATASSSFAATSADPADRYLALDGARLRYRDEGRGPPVILVHGWTLDLEMWQPQIAALKDAFRLVRFDRRGHGLSSGRPDTGRDVTDLAALLRHLNLNRVSLIGMSQGARAVLAFAGAAPSQVSAIILDGPPSMQFARGEDVPLGEFARLVQSQGIEAFRREWARRPLMQLRTRDARTRALLAAMIERYPGTDLTYPAACETQAEPALRLESIIAPALILLGEHDVPSRAQSAQLLCARLQSAERAAIADAGHLPNLDRPDVYSDLCRAFLARHASARA
ncbi:MAG: alpha/beta fold hydrolase [Steroidobacteraceae bacterium]